MMEEDATTVCGARHRRHGDRRGYRWGRTHSEIGYHGGKVIPATGRDRAGKEVSLESWQALRDGNLLLEWALNLMVRVQVPPRGPSARGRPGESAWRRHLEVGRFPALCGAVTQEDEGLARLGSLGTRPASHPDRRSACRRPCPDGGDRRRWQRRQACPGRGRGGDGEHGRRPGLDRQSPRQGARSDTAAAVHRRWREGTQPSDPKHLRCGRRHPALPGPQGP